MVTNIKKIIKHFWLSIFLAFFLFSGIANATTAIPWVSGVAPVNRISPTVVNGVNQGVQVGTAPSSSDYIANWGTNPNLQDSFGENKTNGLPNNTNVALTAIAPVMTQNTLSNAGFTAFSVNPEVTGTNPTPGFMQGAYYSMTYSGSGTVSGGVFGNQVEANVLSGNVDEMGGLLAFNVQSGGTVGNSKALYITDIAKSGGVTTNDYGIWVGDINEGATISDAIKTNAGHIELGSTPDGSGFGQTYSSFASIGYDQLNPLTNTTTQYAPLLISPTITQNTNETGNVIAGMLMDFTVKGTGNFGDVQANVNGATYAGSGTIDGVFGAQNFAQLTSGTATGGLYGGFFGNYMNGGTAGTNYGVYIDSLSKTGGTLTNDVGLFINNVSSGTTNNRAIQTNAGKIIFGDLAGTGTRMVTASSTGQLSTATLATGTVTSVSGSGGTTGLTLTGGPITTSGTLTLGGTLAVANGGTNCASASITCFNNITGFTAAGTTGTTSTNLVFSTSPTLITPALGTPTALVGTNITGTGASFTSGITNALASATTTVNVSSATAPTSGQVLTATSGTAATWQTPSGGGITWTEVTGTTQAVAINSGYILNNASLVTATLPTTAAVGTVEYFAGKGAGLYKIAQNASQIIHFGVLNTTTGVGGSIAANQGYDSIQLVCIVANTEWVVINSSGTLTVN